MVRTCCVTDCNEMPNPPTKLNLFSFPKIKMDLWKQIILLLNNQEFSPRISSKICVKHFESDCVRYNFGKISLSAEANPTIFPHSPINSSEVIDYLISQNAKDPLTITENPTIILKGKSDNPPIEVPIMEKQFIKPSAVFNNMEDITNWTTDEIKNAFNILKRTLHRNTRKIQALSRKTNRLESLLAKGCAVLIDKKSEAQVCKICMKKFPRETQPFYLNVQISDDWLPTFISKFKSCSGDILLTKNDKISSPICNLCLEHVLANYTAVFSGEKDVIKNPILNVDIEEDQRNKIIPEVVVKKLTENTTAGKVVILRKISRSKIPDKLKQFTKKKFEVPGDQNSNNVKIIQKFMKNVSKSNKRKEPVEEAPILDISEESNDDNIIPDKLLKQLTKTKLNVTIKKVPKRKFIESNKREEAEILEITEEANDDIICEYCGEGFSDKKLHLQHQSTHWADMKFVCNNCDTCFLADSDLQLHQIIHCKTAKKARLS